MYICTMKNFILEASCIDYTGSGFEVINITSYHYLY